MASILPSAPAHDFYICAQINRDYVIGSKVVTVNGVYKRTAAGEWAHQGYNDATLTAVAIDPRDRRKRVVGPGAQEIITSFTPRPTTACGAHSTAARPGGSVTIGP